MKTKINVNSGNGNGVYIGREYTYVGWIVLQRMKG